VFTFYDFEVFKHDWLVVFEQDGQITRIHNDGNALRGFLQSVHFLVGFNNHNYDDVIVAALLKRLDSYEISTQIIAGKKPRLMLNKPISIDVKQELKMSLSLKEVQANLGMNIHETPIDFNIDRPLTEEEIELTFKYCENDVRSAKKIFDLREDYFTSKFEIVQTFKLNASAVKRTRARLVADVLKCKKYNPPADRLHIDYDKRLPLHELPQGIVDFYKKIEREYKSGGDFKELESRSYECEIAGVKHTFGFGGLHAAIDNFVYEGNMMQIDVSSYYPSLTINNNFVSRAAESPELFKDIYAERMRLKSEKDSKQGVYKIVLNTAFGASKSEYNPLFDPRQANNITINGQLILTHLILLLKPFVKLVQSNTDGIVIAYEKHHQEAIVDLLKRIEKQYELSFDVDLINKIAQRDVNNYVIQYQDGKIKAKGRFKNHEGGDFEQNSLCVIDKALVDYYIHEIPVHNTIINLFKNNEYHWFQLVAKAGNTFNGIVHEINGDFIPVQKVNRVFASNDKRYGSIYKTKFSDGTTKYHKIPNVSDHVTVHNEELTKFDKRKLDLNFYIQMVKNNLFT
jgi:hypothetical protein